MPCTCAAGPSGPCACVLTFLCPVTQGDANYGNDYEGQLYADGQKWLNRNHIMGRVIGCAPIEVPHFCSAETKASSTFLTPTGLLHSYLPTVGRVTIIMNDQPIVKYLLIGVLAIFVLTSKE